MEKKHPYANQSLPQANRDGHSLPPINVQSLLYAAAPNLSQLPQLVATIERYLLNGGEQELANFEAMLLAAYVKDEHIDHEFMKDMILGWRLLMEDHDLNTLEALFQYLQQHQANYLSFMQFLPAVKEELDTTDSSTSSNTNFTNA